MRKIALAANLKLSAVELATSVTSVLGIRGCGKSNLGAVIVEGLLDAQIPVVVLDRVGIWFSLRLERDGKTPSRFKVPVLGGVHGDIALLPTAGVQVAEALAAGQSSAVLDISRFTQAGRIKFATEFAEAFFEAKKRYPGPVCLVLEEAQRYVPQVIRFSDSGLPRCLGAFEEIAEQGRNYGVGLMLISLRPEKLNKDVMNLSENVFALRMLGVHERKAVSEWVQEHGVEGRDDVKNELPSLPRGRAIFWSPALFETYGKYDILLKSTYDAGKTPHEVLVAVEVKPLDLAALEAAMASVVEEAKANDPRALKAEVARLRRELEKLGEKRVEAIVKPVEVPVVPAEWRRKVSEARAAVKEIDAFVDDLRSRAGNFMPAIADVANKLDACLSDLPSEVVEKFKAKLADWSQVSVRKVGAGALLKEFVPRKCERFVAVDGKPLSRCARALLGVLSQRGSANDSQLAILSGYSRNSSGFANSLSSLKVGGFIVGRFDRREITESGRLFVGDVEPLPAGHSLLNYWVGKLHKCEGALLKAVYHARSISRENLGQVTGYSISSSGFNNGLSKLRVLELVSGRGGEDITIADEFLES